MSCQRSLGLKWGCTKDLSESVEQEEMLCDDVETERAYIFR